MTPEQERKLDALIAMVRDQGTRELERHEQINRLDRRVGKLGQWVRILSDDWKARTEGSIRPPMPTLPEDAGSLEVSAMGARVKATGAGPIRVAVIMAILAVAALSVYYVTHAGRPAMAQEQYK